MLSINEDRFRRISSSDHVKNFEQLGIPQLGSSSPHYRDFIKFFAANPAVSYETLRDKIRILDPELHILKVCSYPLEASVLHILAAKSRLDLIEKFFIDEGMNPKLLDLGNRFHQVPLFSAIRSHPSEPTPLIKRHSTVRQLIKLGANVRWVIPLYLQSDCPRSALEQAAIIPKNIAMIALLLRHGARDDIYEVEENKEKQAYKDIQEAKKNNATEDQNLKLMLQGRVDAKSFLKTVPKEIFLEIVNFMVWK